MGDNVNQPTHYTVGTIEVINYIKDKLTPEQFIGYCIGNVIKYTSRYQHKGGREDLEKAQVYLQWAIDNYPEDHQSPKQIMDERLQQITDENQELKKELTQVQLSLKKYPPEDLPYEVRKLIKD